MKYIKKYKFHILAFLIPILILSIYNLVRGFTSYNLIVGDLREQYIFLFDYLKTVLNGDNSIFYFFGRGLGSSMYNTFFYYLSSPFNIFLALFSQKNIHIFIILTFNLKICLSGLTMYIYLNNSNKNKDRINLLFSLCYALMSYNLYYFYQVMWLDSIILLPLILLGLDKILKDKKSKGYVICLFLSFFCSYYISYMICLFLVLYFVFRILTKYNIKNDKEKIESITKKFIISSMLACFLASFVIFPVFNELKNTYRDLLIFDHSYIYNPFNSILKLGFDQSAYTSFSNYFPHIFCTFLPLVILINYFMYVKDKEKKHIVILLLFMFLSFTITPLLKLWHGFEIPTFVFHRWAFIFSAFTIIIASEKYSKIKEIPFKSALNITITFNIILLLSYMMSSGISLRLNIVIFNFVLLLLTFISINKIKKKYNDKNYRLLLLVIVITIFTMCWTSYEGNCTLKKSAKDANDIYDSQFKTRDKFRNQFTNLEDNYYRLGGNMEFTTNETFPISNGRNQIFLSSNSKKLIHFYQNIGHKASINEYIDTESTSIINTLLGIKYWYNDITDENFKLYKVSNGTRIYKNVNEFSLGYIINYKKIKMNYENPFEYQNSIFKTIYGKEIWKKYELGTSYYNEDPYIYLYADGFKCDKSEYLIVNTENDKLYFCDEYGILKVDIDSITSLDSENKDINDDKLYLYYIYNDELKKFYKELSKNQINIIKIEKNILEFAINSNDNDTLMLTVPYDEGWTIYVDGKKTSYFELIDTFIGVKLDKGNHIIRMVYYPKYLKTGIIVSSIDLILIFVYFNIDKFKKKR